MDFSLTLALLPCEFYSRVWAVNFKSAFEMVFGHSIASQAFVDRYLYIICSVTSHVDVEIYLVINDPNM